MIPKRFRTCVSTILSSRCFIQITLTLAVVCFDNFIFKVFYPNNTILAVVCFDSFIFKVFYPNNTILAVVCFDSIIFKVFYPNNTVLAVVCFDKFIFKVFYSNNTILQCLWGSLPGIQKNNKKMSHWKTGLPLNFVHVLHYHIELAFLLIIVHVCVCIFLEKDGSRWQYNGTVHRVKWGKSPGTLSNILLPYAVTHQLYIHHHHPPHSTATHPPTDSPNQRDPCGGTSEGQAPDGVPMERGCRPLVNVQWGERGTERTCSSWLVDDTKVCGEAKVLLLQL